MELEYYHKKVNVGVVEQLQLRVLENQEISRKSLKYLDLMVVTEPSTQKPKFDVFLLKIAKYRLKTFHRKTYFALFYEFFYNLWFRKEKRKLLLR